MESIEILYFHLPLIGSSRRVQKTKKNVKDDEQLKAQIKEIQEKMKKKVRFEE